MCVCGRGGLQQSVYKVTQVGEPGTASYIMLVETTVLALSRVSNKPYSMIYNIAGKSCKSPF